MDANKTQVRFFGFGTYVGDEVPPEDIKFAGMTVKSKNPKIVLDNGKVVWGCECWWAPEEEVKERMLHLDGRTVIHVDIDEARKEAA